MNRVKHKLKGKVWLYQGNTPWHFVTITKQDTAEIKKEVVVLGGFRSIPVEITLGNTTWKTSIFADKNGEYLLPLKKSIRVAENIKAGDTINYILFVQS